MEIPLKSRKPFLYFPIALLFLFYLILNYTLSTTDQLNPITFEQILSFEQEYLTYTNMFAVFLLLALGEFYFVYKFVNLTLQDPQKYFMIAMVLTEIPLVLGFSFSFFVQNIEFYLPFAIIFGIHYLYFKRRLSPLFT